MLLTSNKFKKDQRLTCLLTKFKTKKNTKLVPMTKQNRLPEALKINLC